MSCDFWMLPSSKAKTLILCAILVLTSLQVGSVNVFAADEPDVYALYINLDGHGRFTVDPESPWGPGYGEVYTGFPWLEPDYGDLCLYEYGTVVTVTIVSDGISNTTNTRYFYNGVTGYGDGGYTGANQRFQVTMISDIEEDVSWRTEYQILFAQSGITTDTGLNTIVTVGGFAKIKVELPFSGWYDYGSTVAFTYSNPVPGTYDLVSTIMTRYDVSGNLISSTPGATITVTDPCTITGTYLPRSGEELGDTGSTTTTTSTGTGTTTATGAYTTGTGWGSGVPLWPPGGIPEIFSGFTETWHDLSEDWRDFWEDITGGSGSTSEGNGSSTGGGFGSFGAWLQGSIVYGIPNWILLLGFFFLILFAYKRDKKKKRRR